ncbi:HAD family hydrolase [Halomonas shantousis]
MAQDTRLLEKARQIRLLALDVDGVMTDGSLHFQADGQEIKSFNILDGQGIKLLLQSGMQVALITGRESPMVSRRADELGIEHVMQRHSDKLSALTELRHKLGLEMPQIAYCGDDLPDLAAICRVGLGISVPNAPHYIRQNAAWVTERHGGQGAVREICDLLLEAQGHWASVLDTYLHGQRRG